MTRDPRAVGGGARDPLSCPASPVLEYGPALLPGTARALVADLLAGADLTAADGGTLALDLDVPDATPLPLDRETTRRLLAPLLARALDGARRDPRGHRRGHGVTITVVPYPNAVEIEFADSGPPADDAGAGLADLRRRATALGGSLVVLDCPDGGTAVTVRLPVGRVALRRAA